MLAQPRMARDRLGRRDREEVAAPLVEDHVQPEARLEPAAEARLRPAHALGDRAQAPALRGVEVQDAVGLAVAHRPQHDRLGLQAPRHGVPFARRLTILCEVKNRVTVYTTEPCGYCRTAKTLLDRRGIAYDEINLAKDADGRAELVARTGMMTFPQVLIDGEPLGGFQELAAADRAGRLAELRAAA